MGTDSMENFISQAPELAEPLAELARFAWESAPELCKPEHQCLDYHRSWSLVRLLLGNGRLPAGKAFFEKAFARIAGHGGTRVLVSGGADHGLSSIVLNAYRAVGVEPDIVFADRCATSCEINARFANANGANIQIVVSDICDLDIVPVDAVVAHSFLPFFEGEKRQAVLDAWNRNTRMGGAVLISNVLKCSEADWVTQKNSGALLERSEKLLQSALSAGYPIEVAHEMVESAQRFWRMSPGRPPGLTENNLRAGLERAGFDDIAIQYSDVGVNDGPIAMVRERLEGRARAEVRAVKKR